MRIFTFILALILAFSFVGCTSFAPKKAPSGEQQFLDFSETYKSWFVQEFPETACYRGIAPEACGTWGHYTLEDLARRRGDEARMLEQLRAITPPRKGDDWETDYRLLLFVLELAVEGHIFHEREYMTFTRISNILWELESNLDGLPKENISHHEDVLTLLREIPRILRENRDLLEESARTGITPPRPTLEGLVSSLRAAFLPEEPKESPFLVSFFEERPEVISEKEWLGLQEAATEVYEMEVKLAVRGFLDYVEGKYIPACRGSASMSALSRGQERYKHEVRNMLGVLDLEKHRLTPEDIHQRGLELVASIRAEMETLAEGGRMTLSEYREFLESERFRFENVDEVVAAYEELNRGMQGPLVGLFPRLPEAALEIEVENRAGRTFVYFRRPSPGHPGGILMVNEGLLPFRWQTEVFFLHEGVGHHVPLALFFGSAELPWYARSLSLTSFEEGVAMYVEARGEDFGFYQDSHSKYGYLQSQMWRAARLAVDTGIHHYGWAEERAVEYFSENTGFDEEFSRREIRRYQAWPAQSLAYMGGQLVFQALWEQAQAEGVHSREFHEHLLGHGPLPLEVLIESMN